jgi:hypothetical protein
LGEYERALAAFLEADEISSNAYTQTWIMRCTAHIEMALNPDDPNRVIMFDSEPMPDIKHSWYQSPTYVFLVMNIAGLTQDKVKVAFSDTSVDIEINQNEPSRFHFVLTKDIIPDQSRVEVSPMKVEVKLKKFEVGTDGWKLCEEIPEPGT